jgi:nucleoid-associated protein Lsr2
MAKIYISAAGECEFLDDIDFIGQARTVRFSLDGIHYEVDLSEGNLQKLRDCLQPFIRFSHVVRRENPNQETSDIGS